MATTFPQHIAEYIIYDNYTNVPKLLENHQKRFDAIIFGGVAPMEYAAERIPQQTIWSAISKSSSSLLRAMMEAEQKGWNLMRISYDSYSRSFLNEIYDEIGLNGKPGFSGPTTGIISHETSRNESSFDFHYRNFREGKIDGCITVLYRVHEMLLEKKIPSVFAYPTKNSIRKQIEFVMQLYSARNASPGNMAICLIYVNWPEEYSSALQFEYQSMIERTNILKQIYRFSEQLQGSVVELSNREYMVLSTREIIEIATEKYRRWDNFSWIKNNSFQTVSIGIGYGKTVAEAKNNANIALTKSLKHKKNIAYLVESSEKEAGPFFIRKDDYGAGIIRTFPSVDERILEVSDRSGLSVNTVQKIYFFVYCLRHRRFCPYDLAHYLNVSVRSTNRILEKLENSGYAFVVGKHMKKPRGRPTRIITISFDSEQL